ncbi:hypothetical protein CJD36_016785 [Flavipsychrobacter stenotrophus]|uniref:Uncharacterized protein n=1 Tax=Flavipsychrobacter stenotrophus TaxID=2077091 RepID=A0A2S7SSL3_9BACT|nr:hypothetical protein [Flavipsychrobacter stenotrophus]PQJ09595.1 hypothetical protein CJD36_016785 [Flavipsychrobacter stenotrophus]
MKKLLIVVAVLLASCHSGASSDKIEKSLKVGFKERTGFEAEEVHLVKTSEYKFEGYVVYNLYGNHLRKNVYVQVDMDHPDQFMWNYNGDLFHGN